MTKQFARKSIAKALAEKNHKICVLFFPDMEKLWRVRKKVAVNQENLNDELFLTNLSLQIAPKCAETWAYRRFLFRSSGYH